MPRIARMVISGEPAVYHIMSRSALGGYPFDDEDKEFMVGLLQQLKRLYFVELIGYCLMSNHFHLLIRMLPGDGYSDSEIKKRFESFFGDTREFSEEKIPLIRQKWSSISEYIKEFKQTFSRYYNKRHKRRGTLWGERFKSVIVENGETLVNCLAYIDLNPVRAKLVKIPEDYRWSSIGYHVQSGNKDNLLSLDFGIKEFDPVECGSLPLGELHKAGRMKDKERMRRYRKYLYEAGAIIPPEKPEAKTIDKVVVEKERKRKFKLSRVDRFKYRTRYFTDSGIIGSKTFVSSNYQRFKKVFYSRKDKVPKAIDGLDGIYSLKRLSEIV